MSENITREVALARSALVELESYKIDLDVSEAQSETAFFDVSSQISLRQIAFGSFHIDFIGPRVSAVFIDGLEVPFKYDGARITFAPLNAGAHEILVKAQGKYSISGEGLHRFRDPLDGETYLYSQFEPADARRVYPNFEQPDLKAKFLITITAPKHWEVLSNGVQVKVENPDRDPWGVNFKRVVFATTKPISTYLTAFIGGPYKKFSDTFSGPEGQIELGYYCRKTLAPYFDFADINTVTKQGLAVFPKNFGIAYPWGKYDSVFVPEYNLGAMENPGCVTFNENLYIHRGHTTRKDRLKRANTILHEMSHMWFGDLVTPKWWDDLWLKESFAEFMGAWGLVAGTEYQEAWQAFAGERITWALVNDQYPTTHPIIADVPDLEAADQVFDGITYAKGAAVLRQLVHWLGEDNFFAGVRRYFAKHAFSTAVFADLLNALAHSSGKDPGLWSQLWLETSGVSTVQVERDENGVRLSQTGIKTETGQVLYRPHLLRVSAWEKDQAQVLQRVGSVELELFDSAFLSWEQLGSSACAAVLPNDGALSYLKVNFDPVSRDAFLNYDLHDPFSRAVVANALWQQVRDANLRIESYLYFVIRNADLQDSALLSQLLNTLLKAVKIYTVTNRESFATEIIAVALEQIDKYSETEDRGLLWRQAIADFALFLPDGEKYLRDLLAGSRNQELRWKVFISLATSGRLERAELDAELKLNKSAKDRLAYLRAVSGLPGSEADTLKKLLNCELQYSNDEIDALAQGFVAATAPAQAKAVFPNYFEQLDQIWQMRSQEIAERIIYTLFPRTEADLSDPNACLWLQTEAKAWIEQDGHEKALVKIVRDCLDDSYRCVRAQVFNAD